MENKPESRWVCDRPEGVELRELRVKLGSGYTKYPGTDPIQRRRIQKQSGSIKFRIRFTYNILPEFINLQNLLWIHNVFYIGLRQSVLGKTELQCFKIK